MAQVFISYRRKGGDMLTHIIYEKLIAKGYSVFYDKESIKSVYFDTRIYDAIDECVDFILVLPDGALDRCLENENDWVRCEIRYALQHKKHIIPIFMDGFSFDKYDLPDDIRDVKRCNGINFESTDFMEARIDRICEFLYSKPEIAPVSELRTEPILESEEKHKKEQNTPSIFRKFFSICRFTLCDFIFMMWKYQVFSARMNINLAAQIFLGHYRTFNMPPWTAFTPW